MIDPSWFAHCATVFGAAAIPFSEIFAAVPLGIVLGLDPITVTVCATLGNMSVAVVIHLLFGQLVKIQRFERWLEKVSKSKLHARMERSGYWILLFFTPWIGMYLGTVIPRVLGLPKARTFPIKMLSVGVYCAVMATVLWTSVQSVFMVTEGAM